MSGFQIIYNLIYPPRKRLISAKAKNLNNDDYHEIIDDQYYRVVTSDYLARGGDGYQFGISKCHTQAQDNTTGQSFAVILKEYLQQQNSELNVNKAKRISFVPNCLLEPDIHFPTIILLGAPHVGKTAMSSQLIGRGPHYNQTFGNKDNKFDQLIGNWLGTGPCFKIIDNSGNC